MTSYRRTSISTFFLNEEVSPDWNDAFFTFPVPGVSSHINVFFETIIGYNVKPMKIIFLKTTRGHSFVTVFMQ